MTAWSEADGRAPRGNPGSPAAMDPRRRLGGWSASALVVASMIGTGVFTTSGFLLRDLGSPWLVLLAWLSGGVIAALGALCYGALGRRMPESGGEYVFLSQTLHPAAGFVAGCISLVVGFSAPLAAVAYGIGAYAGPWLPGVPSALTGTAVVILFAGVHATGVEFGARVQDWFVGVKLALILGLVVAGGARIESLPSLAPAGAGVGAFLVSLVWVSFSYSGWNAAVYLGGEVRDPERWLPRALLIGAGVTTVLYLGLNAVFVLGVPPEQVRGQLDVARIAAAYLGGGHLGDVVSAVILLALATSVSSMVMAGPRVYAQMASDGCLPRVLAGAKGPPRRAIVFQVVVALAMLWTTTYDALLTFIGFTLGLSTALTVVGLVRLRLREGAALRVPGWPWVPGAFLLAVLGMTAAVIARRPIVAAWGAGTIGMALGTWWAVARRQARWQPSGREAPPLPPETLG